MSVDLSGGDLALVLSALAAEIRALRVARDEDRAARDEDRAAAREDRAATHAAAAATAAALGALAAALRPAAEPAPRSSGSSSPAGGGAAPGRVLEPPSRAAQRAAADALKVRLLLDFARAGAEGLNVGIAGLGLPFAAAALVTRGAVFAHRRTLSGGVRHADFKHAVENGDVFFMPAAAGAPPAGQSFFIVLSRDAAVLDGAHELLGCAAEGCQMFALDAVPAALELVVDRVLVGAAEAPAVVHATLTPRARISCGDFSRAAEQWRAEMEPCMLQAAGGGGGAGGASGGSADDAVAGSGSCGRGGAGSDGGALAAAGARHAALHAARRAARRAAPDAAAAATAEKGALLPAELRQPLGGSPG